MLVSPENPPEQARKGRYLWLYLFALAAAEWVTADAGSALGLGLHVALFLLLLVRAYATVGSESDAHVALSLLPLLRVISLTVPLQLTAPTDQLGLVSALFLLSLFFAARALRYGAARALGLNFRLFALQLLIALLGPLLGALIYTFVPLPALADGLQLEGLVRPAASLFTAGVVEEIFFRGLLLTALTQLLGASQGVVLGALLYAGFHLSWQAWTLVGLMLVQGLLYGWLAVRTRSVVGVALAHGLANVALFIALPNGLL